MGSGKEWDVIVYAYKHSLTAPLLKVCSPACVLVLILLVRRIRHLVSQHVYYHCSDVVTRCPVPCQTPKFTHVVRLGGSNKVFTGGPLGCNGFPTLSLPPSAAVWRCCWRTGGGGGGQRKSLND